MMSTQTCILIKRLCDLITVNDSHYCIKMFIIVIHVVIYCGMWKWHVYRHTEEQCDTGALTLHSAVYCAAATCV